jgi:predicted RNase H-related nuclease YkuK (DUF458 family)
MSFTIKGGFDIFRNQIVNIVLQKNNIWKFGMIMYNKKKIFNINSNQENKIELIKYNTKHALVINDMIIYENEKLFMYDINLHINDNDNENIYKNIIYNVIKYNDFRDLNLMRSLN